MKANIVNWTFGSKYLPMEMSAVDPTAASLDKTTN